MVVLVGVSPHQTGLVEAGDTFGHPRDGLARAREHVAREDVGDDQLDIIDPDTVVIDVRLEPLEEETVLP